MENDEPKLKMYVLLRMEPFPFWRKLSPFWMMINPWCKEVVLRKRTLQKCFCEGKIIHGIRKVVQISWSRVGFRRRGLGYRGPTILPKQRMTMSGKPITMVFFEKLLFVSFLNPASLGKAVLLWSPKMCFCPLVSWIFSIVTSSNCQKMLKGASVFLASKRASKLLLGHKKTSYFPWNPGCLIGILIMV